MSCQARYSIAEIDSLSLIPAVIIQTAVAFIRNGRLADSARTDSGEPFHAIAMVVPTVAGASAGATRTGRPEFVMTCSIESVYGCPIARSERPRTTRSKNRARLATKTGA